MGRIFRRTPRAIYAIWLAFLIRGWFYAAFLPLWEGYDEYAHYAYVERIVRSTRPLVDRTEPVPADVSASLQLAPLPWELRALAAPALTSDAFWKLSPEARAARVERLRGVGPLLSGAPNRTGPTIYEALQPPLYYWLAAIPYAVVRNRPLVESVFVLRCFSVIIASTLVPLVFFAARMSMTPGRAIGVAALVALLPELYFDVARVGNECVGIVLFTVLLILCSISRGRALPLRLAGGVGVTLGLGLLTKVYFLTAIPAVLMLAKPWKSRERIRGTTVLFLIAGALSGWWFALNRIHTGTWSGLNEAVMVQRINWIGFIRGAARVDWHNAIDSLVLSHIWFGGWSSLQVRGWIYHFFMGIALAGVAGIVAGQRNPRLRRLNRLKPPMAFYLWFWSGQLYNVVLLFLSKGASTSMGWYFYAVVAAEIILLVQGLCFLAPKRMVRWVVPLLAVCFGALDLYTVNFVGIPYYTGMIAHRQNGPVASFHISQLDAIGWRVLLDRLCATKPVWLSPTVIGVLWICYLAATLTLVGISVSTA
ncbi:MAG: hypothetical protein M3Y07_10340, partial [Acidobacteriota bacterium]|nr:hypothetical protein [Acidobacteriota bacterium]